MSTNQNETPEFEALSYAGQSRRLNRVLNLWFPAAVEANVKRAKSEGRDARARWETLRRATYAMADRVFGTHPDLDSPGIYKRIEQRIGKLPANEQATWQAPMCSHVSRMADEIVPKASNQETARGQILKNLRRAEGFIKKA